MRTACKGRSSVQACQSSTRNTQPCLCSLHCISHWETESWCSSEASGEELHHQVKAPSHLWYFWGLNGLQELWSPIPSSLPTSLLSALKTRTHQSMGFVATGKETPLPRRWTCSFDRCPSPRPSPKALMENCVSPEAAAGGTGQQREAVGPNMQQARRPKS